MALSEGRRDSANQGAAYLLERTQLNKLPIGYTVPEITSVALFPGTHVICKLVRPAYLRPDLSLQAIRQTVQNRLSQNS